MNDRHPWELLVRYAAGDATPDELAQLASWRDRSPENARLLRRVGRLAELSWLADSARHTNAGWERLQRRLEQSAAAREGGARVIPVRRRRFEATLPITRAPRRRGWLAVGVAAAALVAAALAGRAVYSSRAVEMREITARRGERLELSLPDGSHVVLGAESRLRYAVRDFEHHRTLYLEGQGYFVVAHDDKHPFVVHARGVAARAVGTAFGVRAYPDDPTVDVVVSQGRVQVHADTSARQSGAVLDLGDLAQMDSSGRLTVQRGVNLDLHLGWVRGQLIYDMAPLAEVVRDLERWYDVSVEVNDITESDLRVSMTIDPTRPALASFQRLAEVLGLQVVRSDGRVVFSRPPKPGHALPARAP